MQVEYKCNVCRHIQTLDEYNVEKCDAYDEEGNKFRIVYFHCEKCGEAIVLQIDNAETLSLFDEERKLYVNNMRYKLSYKTPPQKQKRKMEKLNKKLKHKRETLFLEKIGETFYDKKGTTRTKIATVYKMEETNNV